MLSLSLKDALQVAARNSRAYQTRKETVFRDALDLDLEQDAFRATWAGLANAVMTADYSGADDLGGLEGDGDVSFGHLFAAGASVSARLAFDLVKLVTLDRESTYGLLADATVSVPLLRGAGRHIVTEPLTQAQRNVVYSLYALERFKKVLAVQVADQYFGVLRDRDRIRNAEENYRRLAASTQRARRLADFGRVPEVDVDEARQDELRARDRWIQARQRYASSQDRLKLLIGLPADAEIQLEQDELDRLVTEVKARVPALAEPALGESTDGDGGDGKETELREPSRRGAGPLELPSSEAVILALDQRLDLLTALGRVEDAQRAVVVAADGLQADLDVEATARAGERRGLFSAGQEHARLRPQDGTYTLGLSAGLPWERTRERNVYRKSLIELDATVRDLQELEDSVKLAVRDAIRKLGRARESLRIQAQAVELAQRRVRSTNLLLQTGRAQLRDVLFAQESLLNAQNSFTAALVDYRIAELEMQRDTGVLKVTDEGLWQEFTPGEDHE